jgi:hypothetical protein
MTGGVTGGRVLTGVRLIAAILAMLLLILAGIVMAVDTSGPTTYVDREYGFSIELDDGLQVADPDLPAVAGPGGFERPDFMVAFADGDGPRIRGAAADVVDVKVIKLGAPVATDDPRLRNLAALLTATLKSRGDSGVRLAPDVRIAGSASCAAEYTDRYGRHGLTCMAVAGSHIYTIDALATMNTCADMRPLYTQALGSFRVRGDTSGRSPPRTYVDRASGFSITCDRRFVRLAVTRGSWAADAMFVFADPLSGVAANGRFRDGLVVYMVTLPECSTAAQRRRFAADVRAGLQQCGMSGEGRDRELEVNGLPAYRIASRRPDGSGDLIYVLFSGDRAYFVEGCAQGSTWATDRRLFEAAMRSVEVPARALQATVRRGPAARRAA